MSLAVLAKRLASGQKFRVFINNDFSIESTLAGDDDLVGNSEQYLDYFEKLKVIERTYNIRFIDLSQLNASSFALLSKIVDVINEVPTDYIWDEPVTLHLTDRDKGIELLKDINQNGVLLTQHMDEKEIVELHGQKIDIGYRTAILLNPIAENLEEVLSGNSDDLIIKSQSKLVRYSYSRTPPKEMIS